MGWLKKQILILFMLISPIMILAVNSGNYTMSAYVTSSGGRVISSGNYTTNTIIGTISGVTSSSNYTNNLGFFFGGGASSASAYVNYPPVIYFVTQDLTPTPVENSSVSVNFNFSASDQNGCDDLNTSTAYGIVQLGIIQRSNLSCTPSLSCNDAVSRNFSCSVDMWYFDNATNWMINASIADVSNNRTFNTSIYLTVQQLTATMGALNMSLNFTGIRLGEKNFTSRNNITIYNMGNRALAVRVNASDLIGEDTSYIIYSANFSMAISNSCAGTILPNATDTILSGVTVNFGNNSAGQGMQSINTCLRDLPGFLLAQNYASEKPWSLTVS